MDCLISTSFNGNLNVSFKMNWNKVTFTFITHVTCDARLVLMQKETKQKQSQCSRKWIDAEKGKLIDLILWKEEMPILSLLKFKFVIFSILIS